MKKLNRLLVTLSSVLLIGCGGVVPDKNELIGAWEGNDGAFLELEENNYFIARKFSKEVATSYSLNAEGSVFNGSGIWHVQKSKGNWEVNLKFKEIDGDNQSNGFYTLIISGSNKLENKPPWYLYVWKDEEGGARNKLFKMNRP